MFRHTTTTTCMSIITIHIFSLMHLIHRIIDLVFLLGGTSTTFSASEVITYGVTFGYLDYQSTYGTYDLYVDYYETPPIVTYEFLDNFDGVGTLETHTPDIGGTASITGSISPISTSWYYKVWIREGAYPPV